MAGNTIKGLTVKINGDTTELGKSLENVNKKSADLSKELGQINRLLKMDPGNADLLAQKQKVLAEAVANTSEKLDKLKQAEAQVQEQFKRGEVSEEQVRALQREIAATEQKLDGYKRAAKETADEVENLGKKGKKTAEELAEIEEKANAVASGGFKVLAAGITAAVTALTAAAEASREYRTAMGKLDTAFTTAGHSSEAATETYQTLQGVLGETDQAVEAANHLAKLADNEEDLATWTNIATGVYATFGDSLPIEGLTEAANETAKTGALTGGLADALNWAGVNEEAFQAQLDACTTEQERQALITSTLNGLYSEAADKYRETNAEVIASNEANEAWMASLAAVGAEVEPLLTKVKNLGAALLENVAPVIGELLDNLPAVAVAVGGIAAALVSYKVAALAAAAAQKGMTLATYLQTAAQHALNVALNANPIGLIILAITALVTAFVYLWNNCEGFRNFWINMWEGIKTVFNTVVTSVGAFFTETLPSLFEKAKAWFAGVGQMFADLWTRIVTWFTDLPTKAREGAARFLAAVTEFFQQLPYKIGYFLGQAIGKLARWVVDTANKAKEAGSKFITNTVNFFKTLPSKVWTWLQNTITKVLTWRANMINSAKQAALSFVNSVINFFKTLPSKVWTWLQNTITKITTWGTNMANKAKQAAKDTVAKVTEGFKNLPSKMADIGKDLIEGLWNGIKNMGKWIADKVTGFASGVLDGIKDAFGVHSPSRETAWIGEMLDRGLAEGILDNADSPLNALARLSDDMLDETAGLNGLTLERQLQHTFNPPAAAAAAESGLLSKLDRILEAIERGQVLTIDGEALVGSTLHTYDNKLGQRRALAARGAL
jgi:phage-related minor tail protein